MFGKMTEKQMLREQKHQERLARMQERKQAEKEKERQAKMNKYETQWKFEKGIYYATTKNGKKAYWSRVVYAITMESRSLGTLTIDGKTIFTRGSLAQATKYLN